MRQPPKSGELITTDHAQLAYVQSRVAKGEYRVNSMRVAEAILQRLGAIALHPEISGRSDRDRRRAKSDRRQA